MHAFCVCLQHFLLATNLPRIPEAAMLFWGVLLIAEKHICLGVYQNVADGLLNILVAEYRAAILQKYLNVWKSSVQTLDRQLCQKDYVQNLDDT